MCNVRKITDNARRQILSRCTNGMICRVRALGCPLAGRRELLLQQYSHRSRHSPHRPGMAAQFGGYLRYANALPGEPDQVSDFLLGPLLWLPCFHDAASDHHKLNSEPIAKALGKFTGFPPCAGHPVEGRAATSRTTLGAFARRYSSEPAPFRRAPMQHASVQSILALAARPRSQQLPSAWTRTRTMRLRTRHVRSQNLRPCRSCIRRVVIPG
ncbi:hypothetical protein ACVI1J_001397 [Bradyrhizobium diazoefficiens]